MTAYENGGHAYYATMPTDGLRQLRDTLKECENFGFDKLKLAQIELGQKILAVLKDKGVLSVTKNPYQAFGVIVCHAVNADIQKGLAFAQAGMQIAAGTPLQVDEPENYQSFRIGLFGLDKLQNIERTVAYFKDACDQVFN